MAVGSAAGHSVGNTRPMSDLGRWEPLTPLAVVALFEQAGHGRSWWIAGGYAIELFVGRELRAHGDIDVLLLRRDQEVAHEVLAGWDIHAADPPGQLRPWKAGEILPPYVHDIWCRAEPSTPWSLQIMLDNSDGEQWYSRRHAMVTRPLSKLGRYTDDGWPYLAPEVQLFYKAKPGNQLAKDEIDFAAALPHLDEPARRWLDEALKVVIPDHHWRAALTTTST